MAPLTLVLPFTLGLNPQVVALSVGPIALEGVAAGPRVDPQNFEPMVPGPRVFPLTLGTRANPLPVGFTILPAPTVGAPVVKVEATPAVRHDVTSGRDVAGALMT